MNPCRKIVRVLLSAGLTIIMTTSVALASIGTGTVTADSLRLRSNATTQSAILANVSKGAQVTILDQVNDEWYRVSYNGKEGYMSAEWLTVVLDEQPVDADAPAADPVPTEDDGEEGPAQGKVTASSLNVRSGPGTDYERVALLRKGTVVTILDDSIDGWYQITDGEEITGYVSAEWIVRKGEEPGVVTAGPLNVRSGPGTSYERIASFRQGTSITILDDSIQGWYKVTDGTTTGYVASQYVAPLGDGSASTVGAAAAEIAKQLLGRRYVYGAAGPNSFDCSGLTQYIYRQLGYSLSRGSSGQYLRDGYFVSRSQMQPGDIVFFFDPKFDGSGGTLPTTHVGIYMGNDRFIHASTTSYTVQYDNLYSGYYGRYVVGIKRIG